MTAKIKLNSASGGGSFSLQAPSSSSNNRVMTLPDTADGTVLTTTNPKAGNTIQVVQTYKTDVFSSTPGQYTWVDVTGLSASITTTGSNKVKVTAIVNVSAPHDGYNVYMKLVRGSTDVGVGDALGSMTRCSAAGYWAADGTDDYSPHGLMTQLLDSPGAGTHTYKIQIQTNYNSITIYTGRSENGTGTGFMTSPSGFITLEEVAV